MSESARLWHWPSAAQWRWTLGLWTALWLWFALVYGGISYLTSLRATRVRIHVDWELDIPFWPASVVLYESIQLVFAMPPFILRTPRELQALTLALAVDILIAGIGFLLLPAEPAFAPLPTDMGAWTWAVQIATTINLKYNMVPSLHVALSVTSLAAFAEHAGKVGKSLFWLWAVAIAASTLLLHQHHVVDVATGWLLGWLAKRFVFDRFVAGSKS